MEFTLKNNEINKIKEFSRFNTLEDFNKSFYNTMCHFKEEFTKSEVIALKALKNRCAKFFGVAYGKIATLVSETHKDGKQGVSRRTFNRMIEKAKDLGILDVLQTQSAKTGGQGNNIYVFRIVSEKNTIGTLSEEQLAHCQNDEIPTGTSPETEEIDGDTSLSYTSSLLKDLYIRKEDVSNVQLNVNYVSKDVPETFVDLLGPFFDASTIEESFYNTKNMFKKESKVYDYAKDSETLLYVLEESGKSLVKKARKMAKKGMEISSPIGYLTRTAKRIMNKFRFEVFEELLQTPEECDMWKPLSLSHI